jgi:hypothetical protein
MNESNIRVRTDRRHRTLYGDFKTLVVKEMHEMFFLCACLGYLEDKRKPLGRNGEDRFYSDTFTDEEHASFYAMIIESNDMNFSAIADYKEVIAVMEEYANAGMQILLEGVLAEYILSRGEDIRLDTSCSKELPKVLLAYLNQKASE